jgi:hypothetical protein
LLTTPLADASVQESESQVHLVSNKAIQSG